MATVTKERRVIYRQRKKDGLCPRCGAKVNKKLNFTYCEDCREFFRNYNEATSEKTNKIRKKRYDLRKKQSLCPRCGKSLGKKHKNILCEDCLKKQYEYNYGKKRPVKKASK